MTQQGAAPDHLQPTISAAGELSREAGARDFDVSYIFLMQTSEAEERFEAMLAEAGFDIKIPILNLLGAFSNHSFRSQLIALTMEFYLNAGLMISQVRSYLFGALSDSFQLM